MASHTYHRREFVAAIRRHRRVIRNAERVIRIVREMNGSEPEWLRELSERQWLAVSRRLRKPWVRTGTPSAVAVRSRTAGPGFDIAKPT
jgi:hypothetical protein